MVRPLRIEYDDAVYHVMNRGRGRALTFHGEAYDQAYLQGIEEADQRFGSQCLAYCLMGNHYHLLIKTPRGNLSRIMRLTYLGRQTIQRSPIIKNKAIGD
ncbi:MAG: transposase [Gammaproteobacteria bacterium]|jgi:REP element-mobilizing transposase RayT